MADLKKPSKALARKGLPPKEEEASNNITELNSNEKVEAQKKAPPPVKKEEIRPLNFKVPSSFRKRFKNFAVDNDVTMSELLVTCFDHYIQMERKQESK